MPHTTGSGALFSHNKRLSRYRFALQASASGASRTRCNASRGPTEDASRRPFCIAAACIHYVRWLRPNMQRAPLLARQGIGRKPGHKMENASRQGLPNNLPAIPRGRWESSDGLHALSGESPMRCKSWRMCRNNCGQTAGLYQRPGSFVRATCSERTCRELCPNFVRTFAIFPDVGRPVGWRPPTSRGQTALWPTQRTDKTGCSSAVCERAPHESTERASRCRLR